MAPASAGNVCRAINMAYRTVMLFPYSGRSSAQHPSLCLFHGRAQGIIVSQTSASVPRLLILLLSRGPSRFMTSAVITVPGRKGPGVNWSSSSGCPCPSNYQSPRACSPTFGCCADSMPSILQAHLCPVLLPPCRLSHYMSHSHYAKKLAN